MAERQAVLTVKYNTNITPAEEERRSECFTDYSRVLTPTAFIQSFNGRAESRILKQNSRQKKKTSAFLWMYPSQTEVSQHTGSVTIFKLL